MKGVLDVNVLVAAFGTRGGCAEVLEYVLARHALVTSDGMVRDLVRVLETKFGMAAERAAERGAFVRVVAEVVEPVVLTPAVCRDADDDVVLGTALAAHAPVIVTGDEDLLTLGEWAGVRIVRPREFWAFERAAAGPSR